ncbi:hypothetical protein ANCCAN_00388 [Ancylostoma caninum]|uniref:Uncharacterized protein n=1 Tax=Ancylostoma caninum TaxID=29170 RepID=A0A368H9V4_ANCCA|nr:hypothetical protein ANCCAN_00388 [Ancylostoma caninum]
MNFGSRRKISARRRESRRWRDPLEKALRPENIQLRDTNMNEEKTNDAIFLLGRAIEEGGIENQIATFLKKKFDEKHALEVLVMTFAFTWRQVSQLENLMLQITFSTNL